MSDGKNDALFDLIKSLTSSEKRYFKIYASKNTNTENNNSALFNAIEKQKTYDEVKLFRDLKNKKIVKHLRFNKHYLFKLILKSLHAYHAEKSDEEKLREQMHYIEILFEKSLYKSCEKIVNNALRVAEEKELFLMTNQLLSWKSKLFHMRYVESRKKSNSIEKQISALDREKNILQYEEIHEILQLKSAQSLSIRKKEEILKLNKLIKQPLMEDAIKATSLKSKYYYYRSYRVYYLLIGDLQNAYNCSAKLLEIFDEKNKKTYTKEHLILYANILIYLIIDMAWLKMEDKFDAVYEKLNNFLIEYPEIEKIKFPSKYVGYIIIIGLTGNFKKINQLVSAYENELNLFKGEIGKERTFIINFNIACLYMDNEEHKPALKWINKVLNEGASDLRVDVYIAARFINLIIHYELENYDLLEFQTRSTYRYLLKKERLHKFEETILYFMKSELIKVTNQKELITAFIELKKDLEILSKDPLEKRFLEYFDFIGWLDKKIKTTKKI